MPTKAARNGKLRRNEIHRRHIGILAKTVIDIDAGNAKKLLDEIAAKNREWLNKAPLIVDPDDDASAPIMVRLNLQAHTIGYAVAIAMHSQHTVEEVLSACLNHGVDIVELSNHTDKPEKLAEVGL